MNLFRMILKNAVVLLVCVVAGVAYGHVADFTMSDFNPLANLELFRRYDCGHLDIFIENDGGIVKFNNKSDKHYTSGLQVNYAAHPQWAKNLTYELQQYLPYENSEGNPVRSAAGFAIGQQIYTPNNIHLASLQPNDRPYAGWLYGSIFYQRANNKHYDHLQIDLGVVGPSALSGTTQSLIHTLFQIQEPKGWDNQLKDEIGFNLRYKHKWKYNVVGHGFEDHFKIQMIPAAGITLGNINRELTAGATLRIGLNLPQDFGPGRIDDIPSYTHTSYRADQGTWKVYNAYFFAGYQASYVEHDTFIQGNNYHGSHSKELENWVGRTTLGISAQWQRFQFTYSETFITKQFVGQSSGDSYATFMLRWHIDF